MRFSIIPLLVWSLAVNALPDESLEARGAPRCHDKSVKSITAIMKQNAPVASKMCSSVLKRGPNPTTTISSTVKSTVISGTTTITAGGGTVTVSSTDTVTVTTGTTTTLTATSTVDTTMQTTVATVTSVITATETAVQAITTNYTPVYAPSPGTQMKRSVAKNLGGKYRNCPKPLRSVDLPMASKACSCFLPPQSTSTVRTTSTVTSTVQNTATITTPAGTMTVTLTAMAYVTSDITETTTSTTITTVLDPVTVTAFSTSTTTTTVTSAATATASVVYNKQLEGSSCRYISSTDSFLVSDDPANNYIDGINDCSMQCSQRADCRSFFYFRFDPNRAGGADEGVCSIDNQPYNPEFLRCGYATQFSTAYNKGAVTVT